MERERLIPGEEFSPAGIFSRHAASLSHRFADWFSKLEKHGFWKFIPYDLRHAYCTDALANGASYADVSKLVGKSPGILSHYCDHTALMRLAGVAAEIAEKRKNQGVFKVSIRRD